MRIMGRSKWRKAFLIYGAILGSLLFCGIAIILTFAQCRPVSALWNPELLALGKARCWPPQRQSDFSIFVGCMYGSFDPCGQTLTRVAGWLAFIDLALALLPITIMWNLKLSLKKKCGISAIMGLGVL